jgi:hypothetical protein
VFKVLDDVTKENEGRQNMLRQSTSDNPVDDDDNNKIPYRVTEGLKPAKDSFLAEVISILKLSVHSALTADAKKARTEVARANFIMVDADIWDEETGRA